MQSAEIRRRWLDFFAERGHTVVPSAPLLYDDPTLLFVNAGMVPFKPYFLGQETPPYTRATSVQKVVRTLDIEEVGKTTRHATFFQMNGNFSFGDYFKQGAIELAWELVTRPVADGGYGLDESKLWVTVLHDDDESIELWRKIAGLPSDRIVRRGPKDNYWSMGVPGPGGPCSEIYIDRGPEYGPEGGPEADEDRYLEFWNLVFMQDALSAVRSKEDFDIAGELPAKNIDTGLGLERMAFLLQGVDNLYESDEVFPVISRMQELSGKRYGADAQDDVRLRVVADHVRSALMLIGDGVTPSNEARGYVLRRILRRVVRSVRLLGVLDPVLVDLVGVSKNVMKASYPELEAEYGRIAAVVAAEEESFRTTLNAGTTILDVAVREAQAEQVSTPMLSGAKAFQLHDTYGFPIELTLEMAGEQGLSVDQDEFRRLMTEQRDRARADARAKKSGHVDTSVYRGIAEALGAPVEFTGYDELISEAVVRGLLVDGEPVDAASEGEAVEVVLDRTPLYAEGGGQLADAGIIELPGAVIQIDDVQSPITGLVVHRARVLSGEVTVGSTGQAAVDVDRRRAISRSHTATHLVHKAIRDALGDTATQAGSENSPGRFRFDFHANAALPPSVVRDVEATVNAVLLEDLEVRAEVMTQEQARAAGAMALFGEKYGDRVRVISVGDWARELCGGTHAARSSQVGMVRLLGEGSIGSGVRRVEALVAADAYQYAATEHVLVGRLTELVKARPEELVDRIAGLIDQLRDANRELDKVRSAQVLAGAGSLVDQAKDVFGARVVLHDVGDASVDDLRTLATDVRARFPGETPGVVAVAGRNKGRAMVVVATTPLAREWGVSAVDLVKVSAGILGGGGGGNPELAQGGGTATDQVAAALELLEHTVGERVTQR